MAKVHTNLVVLKHTRKRPVRGDLFVCNVKGEKWLAGRVIRDDAKGGGWEPEWFLIYIYDMDVSDPQNIETPIKPKLLIPPEVTNKTPWTSGVFQTLRSTELLPEEILPQHCFLSPKYDRTLGHEVPNYVDEDGNQLDKKYEPCGISGLGSYRWTDDRISEALGIEPAPE